MVGISYGNYFPAAGQANYPAADRNSKRAFHGLDILGPSAPNEVKEAWNKAEKETGVNGMAMNSEGMLTQLTKLFVMSIENGYNGGGRDVLGNSVYSARTAVQTALERLGIPQNNEEKKEESFYKAFLSFLNKNSGSQRAFSKMFLNAAAENTESENISPVEDILSAAFPGNKVHIKAGNCDVSSEYWKRNDFPAWRYFSENAGADSLNGWKPTGKGPTDAEPEVQRELSKIAFGRMEVIMPESLQKKMEADPEYAWEISERLQIWKAGYDTMDNAIAASYGDDTALYQITKRYCIQMDEEGNVKDYAVIGGGMDTKKNGGTEDIYNSRLWSPLASSLVTLAKQQIFQDFTWQKMGNTDTGEWEMDDVNVLPHLAAFGGYRRKTGER